MQPFKAIEIGMAYTRWLSIDGCAMSNKMHIECHAAHQEDADANGGGQWEYMPYSYPRGKIEA